MKQYLQETYLVDYNNLSIQNLIEEKKWREFKIKEQIMAMYNFVRDEIKFGFNLDETPASQVLAEGLGQCNTKSNLFMALLRAVDIPCRLHGFTIDKNLQSGIMNGSVFEMMPAEIVHTWTEVFFNNRWYNMEGLILDAPYLNSLQRKFVSKQGAFSGYGVAINDLHEPPVYWNGDNDTYIQKEGIVQDFGVFNDPDTFFAKYAQKVTKEQRERFNNKLRHEVNMLIAQIRQE